MVVVVVDEVVVVGGSTASRSTAPRSHAAPCGRGTPRWSVLSKHCPLSMAGLGDGKSRQGRTAVVFERRERDRWMDRRAEPSLSWRESSLETLKPNEPGESSSSKSQSEGVL